LKSVGLVRNEDFDPNFFPGYLKWVIWAAIKLVGVSPDEYAYYPVYVSEFSSLFLSPSPLIRYSSPASTYADPRLARRPTHPRVWKILRAPP
jgi:hypothetical protein